MDYKYRTQFAQHVLIDCAVWLLREKLQSGVKSTGVCSHMTRSRADQRGYLIGERTVGVQKQGQVVWFTGSYIHDRW